MTRLVARPLVVFALALAGSVVVSPQLGARQLSAQERADEAQAKALAKEAERLVKAKQLVDGRAKYVEALRLAENQKYSQKVIEVDLQIDKQVKKILEQASTLFHGGKHQEAMAKLDETLPLRQVDPAVLYNRALIHQALGDREQAVEHLAQAIAAGPPEKERMRLLQLKTQWETGEHVQRSTPELQEQFKELNEELAAGDHAPEICGTLRALSAGVPRSASVVFNLAKCAEDEGNLEEASRLLDEYLKLAPEATDHQLTKAGMEEAQDLEKRAGEEAVAFYSAADRLARQGHYKRAIDALGRALTAAPQVPETHLKLARLYQASDNATKAREHYEHYLTIETREPLVQSIREEQLALENRSRQYEAIMQPAHERFLLWTHRYVVDGRPMGLAAGRDELESIAADLQRAAVMMPLATDVNRMLGLAYLFDGNYAAARKAFNVLAEAGEPVWFYGTVQGMPGFDKPVIAKLEFRGSQLRVLGLTRLEKKKRLPLIPSAESPGDRLGGFLASSRLPPEVKPLDLALDSVSQVETVGSTVEITWTDAAAAGATRRERQLKISPTRFATAAPESGPAARRFANSYTKLFRDFGDKKVKLGAERLTGGEKFGMVMQVAMAAYSGGAMSAMSGVQGTANIVAAALRSATWATMEIQNGLDAQARMLRATEFKIIPVEDAKPAFRKELFR